MKTRPAAHLRPVAPNLRTPRAPPNIRKIYELLTSAIHHPPWPSPHLPRSSSSPGAAAPNPCSARPPSTAAATASTPTSARYVRPPTPAYRAFTMFSRPTTSS
ncbi:hypothetical protein FS749_002389 [Ceratobasidium sp. UAMH 11750]|nr:hypothetical protein FS749_002389 [Ceratobasidium sp. UAMH 11750]